MTPEQLDRVRLEARIVAMEMVLTGIIRSKTPPAARDAQAREFETWLQSLDRIPFKNMAPEYADLMAAETQEAAARLVQLICANLRR